MKLVTQKLLNEYMQRDSIAELLASNDPGMDAALTCQRWLMDSPVKRFICAELYGDLLQSSEDREKYVVDIGGGLTSLTRRLASQNRYQLIELMAHEKEETISRFKRDIDYDFISVSDWHATTLDGPIDVVIANDLFPNVDQRLELFLDKILPICREVRLSVTFYNSPRFYLTRRIGAEEILCVLAWNGAMIKNALEKYKVRIERPDFDLFDAKSDSVFPNGRQVCLMRVWGGLAVHDRKERGSGH